MTAGACMRMLPVFATLASFALPATAEEPAVPRRPAIAFNAEPTPIEEHGLRVGLTLVVLLALAAGGLYLARKRLPQLRAAATPARLQVLERHRLGPRCTLVVVCFRQREILLGLCGDRLVKLDAESLPVEPPAPGESS